ncbi:response regulator [Flavobacterium johnsoniae]|jgi:DNA-binding NarL/FixJ family response regulator|uniref:DNA-binding response regulator, NarL/FixJ family, contains REC and HTH domains n=2 Tax=Flavobacterium johnsoniae TaxID=986 RepID=A0A1M6P7Q0_FLAJO|nr:response regulator [Flavobacterium johnsoniae]ABQ03826.1 response regulator receiver protein [Flavobacterium johnsoniae UW101]OXG03364.1 response regulator [Flavobacterium johnsoniae UW101]WQG79309.1 response regulator [Flavobacterium johnsoniae UW101]SHH29993.1 DNA-binding response regulator, NarL/FixJ family, contains REC and HTH domains [Flavobacterium johnsoniae]SHK03925.1 DNA-binding response regulator, NarL/FixJ family, contains REC and HTH domains [Flavobacterium johnsoniae]
MTFNLKSPISELIKPNILIVDDHPFIIEGYKNAITRYKTNEYEFEIAQAHDCRSAYDLLENQNTPQFEIAFLDISMPAYEEKNLFSGEDLAKLIMKKMPYCKIILLTMYTELLKIKTIIRTINPNGLIIKNDLTFDELLLAFDKVMNNQKYYSQSVVKMLNQSPHNSIEIDEFDKQILFHLSKGTEVSEMPQYIPISLTEIEKRRVSLKELLKVRSGSDDDLVKEAKSKGLF